MCLLRHLRGFDPDCEVRRVAFPFLQMQQKWLVKHDPLHGIPFRFVLSLTGPEVFLTKRLELREDFYGSLGLLHFSLFAVLDGVVLHLSALLTAHRRL